MLPAWMHLDWFLFGALAGSTAVSAFWCWVIDRRDRVERGRERHYRALVGEQDAQLRGLYQQTAVTLARLAAPEPPHRACTLTWPRQES